MLATKASLASSGGVAAAGEPAGSWAVVTGVAACAHSRYGGALAQPRVPRRAASPIGKAIERTPPVEGHPGARRPREWRARITCLAPQCRAPRLCDFHAP